MSRVAGSDQTNLLLCVIILYYFMSAVSAFHKTPNRLGAAESGNLPAESKNPEFRAPAHGGPPCPASPQRALCGKRDRQTLAMAPDVRAPLESSWTPSISLSVSTMVIFLLLISS